MFKNRFNLLLIVLILCLLSFTLLHKPLIARYHLQQILVKTTSSASAVTTPNSDQKSFELSKIIHINYEKGTDIPKMAYIDVPISISSTTSLPVSIKANQVNYDRIDSVSVMRSNSKFYPIKVNEEPITRAPNLQDRDTVMSLALMSHNSYLLPDDKADWLPIADHLWDLNTTFGWDSNGLRGHLYTSEAEKVVIIAFKGTSPYFLGIGGPTGDRDRFNDNLMFSCCCAKITSWIPTPITPVCDCYKGVDPITQMNTCSNECLLSSADVPESYYNAARAVYKQARIMFPEYTIWFTGHSLGGAVASLTAVCTNSLAVTFASPGDLMYARRLGLEIDQTDRYPVFHFGTDADPVYTGKCAKPRSACYIGGYIIESKCHLGHTCVFQLPGHADDIRLHRIKHFIQQVLQPSEIIPQCFAVDNECQDCDGWNYV